ncbi:hypothetical protein ABTY98_19370 [Streptomyces sp. NPDC096040]|uniref:hypothetical protein n=1 Tax=Streptomyces sp. NPDC096040 TaxID=3155541 RepID=UPI003330CD2C
MNNIRCTQCGTEGLESGFVEDGGSQARGYTRWIAGPLKRGLVGFAVDTRRRLKRQIDAYRCPSCAHLELFATGEN